MEELNVVNDTQTDFVDGQESEQVNTDSSVGNEAATVQSDSKPVQSPEENAKFAEVRRKAEREAQDRLIAEMYGESHGIYTKEDYDRAVAEAKEAELLESLKEEDVDPEEIKNQLRKQWEETDPRIKEYEQIKTEHYIAKQREELNADLAELGIDLVVKTEEDIGKLQNAEKVAEYIRKGNTLAESYFLANKRDIVAKQLEKAQQETIRKASSLDGTSPGALDTTAETKPKSIYSLSKDDFAKMKEDVLMRRRT